MKRGEVGRWKKRALRALLIGNVAALLSVPVVLFASDLQDADIDAANIVAGEKVEASKVRALFDNIQAAISDNDQRVADLETVPVYVNPTTSRTYALNGSVCGTTSNTQGKVAGGYSGAKGLCEMVGTCTASAHVCTTQDMLRFASTGGVSPVLEGWIVGGGSGTDTGSVEADCAGFTLDTGEQRGKTWVSAGAPTSRLCDASIPIICCDNQ